MEKDIGKTFTFSILKYFNMICLLTLIQLTLASPLMVSQRKLQQAMDQTIMNRDLNMAALAEYEPELIIQSRSLMWDPFVGFITRRQDQRPRKHSLWYETICAIRSTIWLNRGDSCNGRFQTHLDGFSKNF